MRFAAATLSILVLLSGSACQRSGDDDTEKRQVHSIDREHIPNASLGDGDEGSDPIHANNDAVSLPFEPPISMDPVDGSKVSIRASTPTTEYGNKIYHFSSAENLAMFLESPEKYAKGALSTY